VLSLIYMSSIKYNMGFGTTSLQVFREFLIILPNGTLDASMIHSRECYASWQANHHAQSTDHALKKFQRALSNHVSGTDGRSPFSPEEERAILQVLRLKQRWPCVPGHLTIGVLGFRTKGYHEKLAEAEPEFEFPTYAYRDEVISFDIPGIVDINLISFDLPGIIDVHSAEEELLKGWISMKFSPPYL
jgi:hypothetical protein